MARPKKPALDLASIASERARLQEQLAILDEAEKAALESERDAGRETLFAALDKIKIGRMERADAKALAQAISTLGARQILERIVPAA
jgi:hypothetical protein